MADLKSNDRGAMYGISRIDDPGQRTHAWRVSLGRQGKKYVKNFPDKKYSGKCAALQVAKHYRDFLVVNHAPTTRRQFCSIIRRNNNSGISGVYTYAKSYVLNNGKVRESWYWEANWPNGKGRSAKASFSVNRYGEDIARQLAIRARQKGLDAVSGVFWASERGVLESEETQRNR